MHPLPRCIKQLYYLFFNNLFALLKLLKYLYNYLNISYIAICYTRLSIFKNFVNLKAINTKKNLLL